jgi:hypothetical protein
MIIKSHYENERAFLKYDLKMKSILYITWYIMTTSILNENYESNKFKKLDKSEHCICDICMVLYKHKNLSCKMCKNSICIIVAIK